jgi:hypothetical protein
MTWIAIIAAISGAACALWLAARMHGIERDPMWRGCGEGE